MTAFKLDQYARRLVADPGLPVPKPTTSYWLQPFPNNLANIQSDSLPSERDVVIIGSGITGCSVTRWLLQGNSNLSITMLEARTLCSGATGRNGGHIKCVPVTDYPRLLASLGHDAAAQIVRFVMAHYDAILASVQELGAVNVGEIRPVTSVTVALEPSQADELRDAHTLFEKAFPEYKGIWRFYEGAEAREKFELQVGYAAISGPAGAAWPYRMITEIYRKLLDLHGDHFFIETSTPALEVTMASGSPGEISRYLVKTPRGNITARHVVYCTEAHTPHLLPRLRGIIYGRRGQMTVQQSNIFPRSRSCYSWSFRYKNGFDYMCQNAETGEIFIGGGEVLPEEADFNHIANPSDAEESVMAKVHLRGILQTVFGGQPAQTKATWTGVMGFSVDGLPLVGRLPPSVSGRLQAAGSGSEWIAAGFGGYGMVNSWLSGKALAQLILSQPLPNWFPDSYVLSEERIESLNMSLETKLASPLKFRSLL